MVALVKPQFEAGREDVGAGGIVRDAAVHERVVAEVVAAAAAAGIASRRGTDAVADRRRRGQPRVPRFTAAGRRPERIADAVDWPPIRRVGIVVKPRLDGGPRVVRDLIAWLEARGDRAGAGRSVRGDRGQRLAPRRSPPTRCRREVDLIVVLGGDGTLLATAGRIARRRADVAVLAVNFGSLGFLTEITLPELYAALERVVAGTARGRRRG